MKFTFSTMTRSSPGRTISTRPRLPFSFPAITATVSSFFIPFAMVCPCLSRRPAAVLQNFRREGDDLHVAARAQFAGHRPEDAAAERLALGVDDHGGVSVEL